MVPPADPRPKPTVKCVACFQRQWKTAFSRQQLRSPARARCRTCIAAAAVPQAPPPVSLSQASLPGSAVRMR
eukprot:3820661-Rhodomonas_salina.1